ncbi:MAG: heme o synthase [Myxococcota bacterium]
MTTPTHIGAPASPFGAIGFDDWRSVVQLAKPRITMMVGLSGAAGVGLAQVLGYGNRVGGLRSTVAILGLALVISSANALNMLLERDSDAMMRRTRDRPLPAGRMTPAAALLAGAVMAVVGIPLMMVSGGVLPTALAAAALFLYVSVYTPMKRRSVWALHVGAIPGALPPLVGWTVATGSIDAPGVALFAVLFWWQLPHFIAIATFRRDDYMAAGIRVLPSRRSLRSTWTHTVWTTVGLVVSSLVLVGLGLDHLVFSLAAVGLGAWLTAAVLRGSHLQRYGDEADAWARKVFVATLVYWPLLLASMFLTLG